MESRSWRIFCLPETSNKREFHRKESFGGGENSEMDKCNV